MGLCERCKKVQATFHLTNIDRDGARVERHLCDKCAGEEGVTPAQKGTVDLDDLLQGFVGAGKGVGAALSGLTCDNCGISYYQFRNHGLLGCAHDYEVFREPLAKLIEKAHAGATHHTGKAPGTRGTGRGSSEDLRKLRRQLDEAITAEDYERAAQLRDRIRSQEQP